MVAKTCNGRPVLYRLEAVKGDQPCLSIEDLHLATFDKLSADGLYQPHILYGELDKTICFIQAKVYSLNSLSNLSYLSLVDINPRGAKTVGLNHIDSILHDRI